MNVGRRRIVSTQMPSRGVDIVEGIPVYLKEGVMYTFQSCVADGPGPRLGTYDATTKKAAWDYDAANVASWLQTYRENLVPRSRK
jgi:hypothetical protein